MSEERHFPLHVLVITDKVHGDNISGLAWALKTDPAVRSKGFEESREKARAVLGKHEVNTIVLDLDVPELDGPGFDRTVEFIDEAHRDFPATVFVIYAFPVTREEFLKEHPKFEHYFHLAPFDDLGCHEVLRRCEAWHKDRFEYDIALSFAGSNRAQAKNLATALDAAGVTPFSTTSSSPIYWVAISTHFSLTFTVGVVGIVLC